MGPGAFAVSVCVIDAHHHVVRELAGSWRPALSTHVGNDHGPVADTQLRAVVLADPNALDKPERPAQPVDCLAYIRIDEDGNDGGLRNCAVVLHAWPQTKPLAIVSRAWDRRRSCTCSDHHGL